VGQKAGPQTRDHNSIITNLKRFIGKLAVKRKKNSPHLAYVATLPCETSVSAKQALNDKLQGSIAAFLRCDGVSNKQI